MDKEEDIFDIRLDEQGKRTVGKAYSLMKLVFWVSLTVECIVLVNGAVYYFRHGNESLDFDPLYFWSVRIYIVYLIVISILVILQSFYFLTFTRQARESIKINDSFGFNNSFAWMYKSLRVTLIVVIINGLYFLFDLLFLA